MNILICAGNGGIGQGLVSALKQRWPDAVLHATYHRTPPIGATSSLLDRPSVVSGAHWYQVDLTDPHQVKQLAQQLPALDWLINSMGFLHQQQDDLFQGPEKSIRQFDPDFFQQNIRLNTVPTLLLAQHFSSALRQSKRGVFAAISAKVGSIEDNKLGGWYSYRASKAALNMVLKNLSIEWQRSHKNLAVAALHPGTTDTGLSVPFQRNVPADKLFTPEQTGHYLLNVIEQLTPENSGKFWNWNGDILPW